MNNMTQKEFASLGGQARANKLTAERRIEIAKKAVQARIEKRQKFSTGTCLQDNTTNDTVEK
jgi:hypothetical protein